MNAQPAVKCPVCGSPAPLVAGSAVTRLYRCPKCTNQMMLPADVAAPYVAQTAVAAQAAAPRPAAAMPGGKGGFLSSLIGKFTGQA